MAYPRHPRHGQPVSAPFRGPSNPVQHSYTPFNRRSYSYSNDHDRNYGVSGPREGPGPGSSSGFPPYYSDSGNRQIEAFKSDTIRASGPLWLPLRDLANAVQGYLQGWT